MTLEPGQIIEGKYRIVRLLGEGGMGAVYEGENVKIQRRVAIKVLHAGVAENVNAVSRFEKEAQAAGRIGSDHITEVLDIGNFDDGSRYMVMEYLDGSTLSDRIKQRGRMSPMECSHVLIQLLEGLQAAHNAGIIHRDLKPDNVFLLLSKAGRKDFIKILDFGISKFNSLSGDSAMSMTRTGAVMGTPYYMSPEQAKGAKSIDARSDLYAVGVILYEAITGQVPFNADTFNELIFKIVLDPPVPPEQFVPTLDPAFSAIIRKAMAREPEQRFQTSTEFQQALLQWVNANGGMQVAFEESYTSVIGTGTPSGSSPSLPGNTPSPWSNTAADQGQNPKRNTATMVFAAVAVFGLMLLAGSSLLLFKLKKGDNVANAAQTAAPAKTDETNKEKPADTKTDTKKTDTDSATKTDTSAKPPTSAAAPETSATKTEEPKTPPVAQVNHHRYTGGGKPAGGKPAGGSKPPPAGGNTGGGKVTAGGRTVTTDLGP
jgi:eukaryotic-like serine/threonine-protein kinase